MKDERPIPDEAMSAMEQRVRGDLRRLVDATDPAIRAKLEQAAEMAARLPRRRSTRALWMALPIGAAVAAASVFALLLWRPAEVPPAQRPTAADDLALLLNVDNLDLLEQMEFYQWLDRDPALIESVATPGAQRS